MAAAPRARKTERRTDALSRERIIEAAVELLDASGEAGLTFRVLTERLATGPGAIYHHVANKSELLDAATDAVAGAALGAEPTTPKDSPNFPQAKIRAVALGLFDAIDEHPWLAAQLASQISRNPWRSVPPRIFESIGRQVQALGVPLEGQFTAASALMHYILGAAGQNAVNGRAFGPEVDRGEFLDSVASAWEELDPDEHPFTRAVADQLRDHDDREQFLSGVTLILAGVTALHPPTR
jgi:AcrR family transcriptional regulator